MARDYKTQDHVGDWEIWIDCPECDWEGLVYYRTKTPQYCSDACKMRAYRKRKKVTNGKNESVTLSLVKDEQHGKRIFDDQGEITIVQLWCDCPRAIFAVPGNVQIGGLRCDLCRGEFKDPSGAD